MTDQNQKWLSDFQLGSLFGMTLSIVALCFAFSAQTERGPAHYPTDEETNHVKYEKHEDDFWHWITADAAGFYTAALTVVGGLQAGFFYWQLLLIRRSAEDTKMAAEAAVKQADLAIKALDTSNRPWITAPRISFEDGVFRIEIRNVGNSPTMGMYVSGDVVDASDWAHNALKISNNAIAWANYDDSGFKWFAILPGEMHVQENFPSGLSARTGHDWPDGLPVRDIIREMSCNKCIVGAIIYGSHFDTIKHQTVFGVPVSISDANKIQIGHAFVIDPT